MAARSASDASDAIVPLLDDQDGVSPAGAGAGRQDAAEHPSPWSLAAEKEIWRDACCFGLGRARCCAVALLLLVGAILLMDLFVLPRVLQRVLDDSTLTTVSMFLTRPSADRITLNATAELHDAGMVSATVLSGRVGVFARGHQLGVMEMPELDVKGSAALRFNLESELLITNATAFTDATARVLQGSGGQWFIKGNVKVKLTLLGWTRRFAVQLDKAMEIPPTLLEDVRGTGGDVVEGTATPNSVDLVARTSLFSSSVLEMHHLGEFVFDLEVPETVPKGADGEPLHGRAAAEAARRAPRVKVGEVIVDDFDVRQGLNDMPCRGKVLKTAGNARVLGRFMSQYLNGVEQVAVLRGPTRSKALFLDNVVEQPIVFEGSADSRPVEVSLIDRATSFEGFHVRLSNGTRRTYRGPKIIVHNTLSATYTQYNVSTFVYLEEPIAFKIAHPVLGHHNCPRSSKFARLFTAEGMHKGDPDRPPTITFAPRERKTVFLPGEPMPGQVRQSPCTVLGKPVADGADCCFVALQVAAACRAKQSGAQSFPTALRSNLTMGFGPFLVDLQVSQWGLSTSFTDDVTTGFLADAGLSCSHLSIIP